MISSTEKPSDAHKFASIVDYGLVSILARELFKPSSNIERLSFQELNLDRERADFLDFVYGLVKRHNNGSRLHYSGLAIRVGIILVGGGRSDCIEYYVRKLNQYSMKGFESIYLLAIGRVNSWIASETARAFANNSDYHISAVRRNFQSNRIRYRTIVHLSKGIYLSDRTQTQDFSCDNIVAPINPIQDSAANTKELKNWDHASGIEECQLRSLKQQISGAEHQSKLH